ncbi:hypothetical protein HAX54_013591 [Datura stramonium]|uniref:Uncharacterized protein n=1 Tax=Datura stramonium TaxID=4076 RepID=A0ABS8TP29_DATST|nr:hypothetical protein [Datura stramonium]
MTVVTHVEKSGQQVMCKETFKEDGMAGVAESAYKNSSATKEILSEQDKVAQYTDNEKERQINERQLVMVDDDHQSTSLTTAVVNFKFIRTQILENVNPLHALAGNIFTCHATYQSKENINAIEKRVFRIANPFSVIKSLMITFSTSDHEISSQSFELVGE